MAGVSVDREAKGALGRATFRAWVCGEPSGNCPRPCVKDYALLHPQPAALFLVACMCNIAFEFDYAGGNSTPVTTPRRLALIHPQAGITCFPKYAPVPLGEGRVVLHRTKSRSLRNRVTVYSRHVESYRDSVQALCVDKSTYLVRMA